MASVPISAITPLLVQLSTARPLPEPVTMAQATAVGAATAIIPLLVQLSRLPEPVTMAQATAVGAATAMALVMAIRLTAMAMAPATATPVMAMAPALSAGVSMPPLGVVGAKSRSKASRRRAPALAL